MNIQQISANIDRQLVKIELQLAQLNLKVQAGGEGAQEQVALLEQMKAKLLKSKALAMETQALVGTSDSESRRQKRLFGMGLAITSSLGILVLLYLIIAN